MSSPDGIRYIEPGQLRPTPQALAAVLAADARRLGVLPLAVDETRIVLAFADAPSGSVVAEIALATTKNVVPVLADPVALTEAIATAYPGPPLPTPARPPMPSVAHALPSHIDELLDHLLEAGGSDLHLSAGAPPSIRVHGSLRALEGYGVLDGETIEQLVFPVLDEGRRSAFKAELELDVAYAMPGRSRFRMNVFRQRGSVGAVLRAIPFRIPDFDTLGLPPIVKGFAELPRGLVLVTGPTGSGKSTTLASLLDIINRTKAVHIISCEDPIEFLHSHQKAIVNQREVGQDTHSFGSALKRALREDPDVILVGEMRDLETIHMALTAAETGHLVFATLHTQSAPQTVDRIVDVFPPEQQGQIRVMLATTLQAVVTQQLVPTANGKGRAVAAEVLVATPAVRNLIRESKGHQIPTQMQAGAQYGMVTMDQHLAELVRVHRIALDTALERAANPDDLRNLLGIKGPTDGSSR
ncbi:MAG: PilT/PilU family type 4a pilus ATPase [Acidimicrobiia bacterium]